MQSKWSDCAQITTLLQLKHSRRPTVQTRIMQNQLIKCVISKRSSTSHNNNKVKFPKQLEADDKTYGSVTEVTCVNSYQFLVDWFDRQHEIFLFARFPLPFFSRVVRCSLVNMNNFVVGLLGPEPFHVCEECQRFEAHLIQIVCCMIIFGFFSSFSRPNPKQNVYKPRPMVYCLPLWFDIRAHWHFVMVATHFNE